MDKAWLWAVSRDRPGLLGQARLGHLTDLERLLAGPTDFPSLGQAVGPRLVQDGIFLTAGYQEAATSNRSWES